MDINFLEIIESHRDGQAQVQAMRLLALVAENKGHPENATATLQVGELVTKESLSQIIQNSKNGIAQMQALRILLNAARAQGQSPEINNSAESQLVELLNNGKLQTIAENTVNPDLKAICLRSLEWLGREGSPARTIATAEKTEWIRLGILDRGGKLRVSQEPTGGNNGGGSGSGGGSGTKGCGGALMPD